MYINNMILLSSLTLHFTILQTNVHHWLLRTVYTNIYWVLKQRRDGEIAVVFCLYLSSLKVGYFFLIIAAAAATAFHAMKIRQRCRDVGWSCAGSLFTAAIHCCSRWVTRTIHHHQPPPHQIDEQTTILISLILFDNLAYNKYTTRAHACVVNVYYIAVRSGHGKTTTRARDENIMIIYNIVLIIIL